MVKSLYKGKTVKGLGLSKDKAMQSFYANAIEVILTDDTTDTPPLYKILTDAAIQPSTNTSQIRKSGSREKVVNELLTSSKSRSRINCIGVSSSTQQSASGSILIPYSPSFVDRSLMNEGNTTKNNESFYSSNKHIPIYTDKSGNKNSRVGSPKPSALDRLKKVFQGERVAMRSPQRNIRLGSALGSPTAVQDGSILKGLMMARKTQENPKNTKEMLNVSAEIRLNKDYKSMNNLGQGFSKKKVHPENQRATFVEANDKELLLGFNKSQDANGSSSESPVRIEQKLQQYEKKVSELTIENCNLKQRNYELERTISALKLKNNVDCELPRLLWTSCSVIKSPNPKLTICWWNKNRWETYQRMMEK